MHLRFRAAGSAQTRHKMATIADPIRRSSVMGTVSRLAWFASINIVMGAMFAHAQEPVTDTASHPPSTGLAPGDTIEAHFIDFPEASDLHLAVSPEGNLFVPYVGLVRVA